MSSKLSDNRSDGGMRSDAVPPSNVASVTVLFANPRYDYFARSLLAALLDTGALADVVVRVDDVEFRCHRVVLRHASRYFERIVSSSSTTSTTTMTSSDWVLESSVSRGGSGGGSADNVESNDFSAGGGGRGGGGIGQGAIVVADVDKGTFRQVLDFIYRGQIDIGGSSTSTSGDDADAAVIAAVQRLLPVAIRYELNDLTAACINHAVTNLSPSNCLGVWSYAGRLTAAAAAATAGGCNAATGTSDGIATGSSDGLASPTGSGCATAADVASSILDMAAKSRAYALWHFDAVVRDDAGELLELNADQLRAYVGEAGLRVRCEEDVCSAVLRWLHHRPAVRERHIVAILAAVRLEYLDGDYVRHRILGDEVGDGRDLHFLTGACA